MDTPCELWGAGLGVVCRRHDVYARLYILTLSISSSSSSIFAIYQPYIYRSLGIHFLFYDMLVCEPLPLPPFCVHLGPEILTLYDGRNLSPPKYHPSCYFHPSHYLLSTFSSLYENKYRTPYHPSPLLKPHPSPYPTTLNNYRYILNFYYYYSIVIIIYIYNSLRVNPNRPL